MNKLKNDQFKSAKSNKTKTPQWMRDVATGSKMHNETASQNISPAVLSDNRFDKINTKTKPDINNISSPSFKSNNKIKKAHQGLVSIEELRKKDIQNEDRVEKLLEQDEEKINKLLNKRFNK